MNSHFFGKSQFLDLVDGKVNEISNDIIIFGAGYWGKGIVYLCEFYNIPVHVCFDNDPKLKGTLFYHDIKCELPYYTDKLILISFLDTEKIEQAKKQLNMLGCSNYADINHMELEKRIDVLHDKEYVDLLYYRVFNRRVNWENPISFNEKIQWLKINDRKDIYTTMVDKFEVKEFVKSVIGEEYIIPTIAVWDSVEDIDFDGLPSKYVLKCTHDSGSVILVDGEIDRNIIYEKLRTALSVDYYRLSREWPYKNVRHRIIAEKLLENGNEDINDYKFFCFSGVVRCFKIDYDRKTFHHANYYDRECNLLEFGEVVCPPVYDRKISIPDRIDEMIQMAEKLSQNIPFLRVDFYCFDNKIYFGELTFSPCAGFGRFTPDSWDDILGSWIELKL